MENKKTCFKCKILKKFSEFTKFVHGKYGLASRCRDCMHLYYVPNYKPKLKRLPVLDNPTEVWKDILGYEGLYQVSNYGNVKTLSRIKSAPRGLTVVTKEHLLRQSKNKFGYLNVVLQKEGTKRKTTLVHRLVAFAFIPNIKYFPQVNHINRNKEDNYMDNLEWVDNRENVTYRFIIDTTISSQYPGVHFAKHINKWAATIAINKKTHYLGSFYLEEDAATAYTDALERFGLTNKYA